MAFAQAAGISLAFGDRDILKDVNINISDQSRIGLCGANGSGKSTLLKILAGIIKPDSGTVSVPKGVRISYLPQSGLVHAGSTLKDEAEKAFDFYREKIQEKEEIASRLARIDASSKEIDALLLAHHELEEFILASGYYSREEYITQTLLGLGFAKKDFQRDCAEFSGGWQMRIALAKVLLAQPDILLLDEPTNYLDLEARAWLLSFIKKFKGGIVIVSHDRYFLDETIQEVAELFLGRLKRYKGNYSEYERVRKQELATLLSQYRAREEEIEKTEAFINRFRYNASKAQLVQSRIKYLEKLPHIEIPDNMKTIHFTFPSPPHSGKQVLTIEGLSKSYGDLTVFRDVHLDIKQGEKLVLAGKNGAGKSTLMRIIAGMDSDYTGSVRLGTGVTVGYFSQDREESFDPELSVYETLAQSSPTDLIPKLRGLLGAFLFRGDDIYKKVAVLSGGEKSRLSLLSLLLHPANLLLLDEPTNHLDLTSKDVLLDALTAYKGTLIFVSHDRYFIEKLATKVLELGEGNPRLFMGDYTYYLGKKAEEAEANGEHEGLSKPQEIEASEQKKKREDDKRQKSLIRKLEREEEAVLARLDELHAQHEELTRTLADPAVYTDGLQVKEVKALIQANEEEQAELTARWERIDQECVGLKKQL